MEDREKKRKPTRLSDFINRSGIRYTVFISFSVIAIFAIAMTAITLYLRFSTQLDRTLLNESEILVEQVNQSLSAHLRNTIRLSNSVTYNVVKNKDINETDLNSQLQLLYNTHSDYAESIVLFSEAGDMLAVAPPSKLKESVRAREAEWFRKALGEAENLHFSAPHVQNLFVDAKNKYNWVVSLSCAAEVTRGKAAQQGVLLVDIRYGSIAELFDNVTLANEGYLYLIDAEGNILYHPQQQLIVSGFIREDNLKAASLRDGAHTLTHDGAARSVILRSVGYTGWRVVGVVPQKGLSLDRLQNVLFVLLVFCLFFELVIIINSYLSSKLTDPIKKLELSVQRLEQDADKAEIYIGGSYEIERLGISISRMVKQLRKLTDDIVAEHEQKQKSERNALQAQINPHFLYNTLDIIVWMIEKQQPEEAVKIVSALARFFRLSLSGGKNIIPVREELEQVRNYLMIQEMRYKNKFTYRIDAEEAALGLSVIKLVLQPIVENAIYHGMEFMDGDGEIRISAAIRDEDLYLSVSDNGLGMPQALAERLLLEPAAAPSSKGSGIGVWNVNERIKLYFGDAYGLSIASEPDEGTTVTLHLPAVPFGEMEEQ